MKFKEYLPVCILAVIVIFCLSQLFLVAEKEIQKLKQIQTYQKSIDAIEVDEIYEHDPIPQSRYY